jgi:hypothetical protein
MSFTTEEVQAAVDRLVNTSIRRPYGALGNRQLDLPFADYQNAAACVFLLAPRAPFYVLYLASLQVNAAIRTEALLVDQLLAAVSSLGRQVFPVTDLSPLANAGAALEDLGAAALARKSSFGDVGRVPAFQRFKQNVDAFLQKAGSNVKLNGELVQTPQQARGDLPQLLRSLKEAHLDLVDRVGRLAEGMEDYGRVNLPSLVAAGVIARAREVLAGHFKELSALSPEQRLEKMRQVVLELCASKAAVKTFSSFNGPSSYLSVTGVGMLFADTTHPATPAVVVPDAVGPFGIYAGRNLIDLFVDVPYPLLPKYSGVSSNILPLGTTSALITIVGADFVAAGVTVGDVVYMNSGTNDKARWLVSQVLAPTQIQVTVLSTAATDAAASLDIYRAPTASLPLARSLVPELKGTLDEPYAITVDNQVIELQTSDTVLTMAIFVTFTLGTFNADEIAAQINAALTGLGMNLQAAGYFGTKQFGDYVNISVLGANAARFTLLSGTPSTYGLQVGDMVAWPNGATFTRWTITALGMTWVDTTSASTILGPVNNVYVEMGKNRRVRFFCPDAAAALELRTKITTVNHPAAAGALDTLGFFPGTYMQARLTTAKEVARNVNGLTTTVFASTTFEGLLESQARTEPLAPSKIIFSKWRTIGDITDVTGVGPYFVTMLTQDAFLTSAGVDIGDIVVLRTGGSAGLFFTITDIEGGTITAQGASAPNLDAGIRLEVGPNFTASYGMVINVPSGQNNGDFYVEAQQPIPIEVLVQQSLPVSAAFNQPIDLGACALGYERVAFSSLSRTTASYVFVREPSALLTTAKTAEGFMSTSWFKLPEVPQALEPGDLLELYRDQYNVPTVSHVIDELDSPLLLLQVSPELSPELLSYGFAEATAVPFARLRAGKVINFGAFRDKLIAWLGVFPMTAYFTNLNRLIAPLLINRNPTAVQINDARIALLGLAGILTLAGATAAHSSQVFTLEDILRTYNVDPVATVDTLIRSYAERGLDRAVDLLLTARFTDFFNLTMDGASYTGDLMQKARAVAQQDLPVSRVDRAEATVAQNVQTSSSPDFEYDHTDAESGEE